MIKPVIFACAFCVASAVGEFVWAEETPADPLQGDWVVNEDASDSVKEQFEKFAAPRRGGFRQGGIGTGRNNKLGRHGDIGGSDSAEDDPDGVARRATMRKIVSANAVHIDGARELSITYDEKFTRNLVPNPYGRVFSASGRELVDDEFGHTLSYWKDGVLVLETTTPRGVDVVERYRYDPQKSQLMVSTSVTPSGRPGIEFIRVFDRVAQ